VLRAPAEHAHGPLLGAERGASAVVVVLDRFDGRIDRGRLEAAASHQLDLGCERP
jgi:hypothetical protein